MKLLLIISVLLYMRCTLGVQMVQTIVGKGTVGNRDGYGPQALLHSPSGIVALPFEMCEASVMPTSVPTAMPSSVPSGQPTSLPSSLPTSSPSSVPTSIPSSLPTSIPTSLPSALPTSIPTAMPTSVPSSAPTSLPSSIPSALPSSMPTSIPTSSPTDNPTSIPSSMPTALPTSIPTASPSTCPTSVPTSIPTSLPTALPTSTPSSIPSSSPTSLPTAMPSSMPSSSPTCIPTALPSAAPTTSNVTRTPTSSPSSPFPSSPPTAQPSSVPSRAPTPSPTTFSSPVPTVSPSAGPTSQPSRIPTSHPTVCPSSTPTSRPSSAPTHMPSAVPTRSPTFIPTYRPTCDPTFFPTASPTHVPTHHPTRMPTFIPSAKPSVSPTYVPTSIPTHSPTSKPSNRPSYSPTRLPSSYPTSHPTHFPTSLPTSIPTINPTASPRYLIFSDSNNHLIKMYNFVTQTVVTICGSVQGFSDGIGKYGKLNNPVGLALHPSGSSLLVVDSNNHCIRKLSLVDYHLSTVAGTNTSGIADGFGLAARFLYPHSVAFSPDGLYALISDFGNHLLRKLIAATGEVITVAGSVAGHMDEVGLRAKFRNPAGVSIHPSGEYAFVADSGNNRIRKYHVETTYVSTYCGTGANGSSVGACSVTQFNAPLGVHFNGDRCIISDTKNNRLVDIRMVYMDTVFLAGTGGAGNSDGGVDKAKFYNPSSVYADCTGVVMVTDTRNHVIKMISSPDLFTMHPTMAPTASDRITSTGAGSGNAGTFDGIGTGATLNSPSGIAMHHSNEWLLIADSKNHRMRRYVVKTRAVDTVCGAGSPDYNDGIGILARFNTPQGVAMLARQEAALVTDSKNNRIRIIRFSNFAVSTFAGNGFAVSVDGTMQSASFNEPFGIAISANDTFAIISDRSSHMIRMIRLDTGRVSTVAGANVAGLRNGVGTVALFNSPHGVAINASTYALIADKGNNIIRHINLDTKEVTIFCGMSYAGYRDGSCDTALFNSLHDVTISENSLLVAEETFVRRIDMARRTTFTLTGKNFSGYLDGSLANALFRCPFGIATSTDGHVLYVTDYLDHRIRISNIVEPLGPSVAPTKAPFFPPTFSPTAMPTVSKMPLISPQPTAVPTSAPSLHPTFMPTVRPTLRPTSLPSLFPTPAATINSYSMQAMIGGGKKEKKKYSHACKVSLQEPTGLVSTNDGTFYFVESHSIYELNPITGKVLRIAGCGRSGYADGLGKHACFNQPYHIALHPLENYMLVTDSKNYRIRAVMISMVDAKKGYDVTTRAGNNYAAVFDGTGSDASFYSPYGIAIEPLGRYAYITETKVHLIRRLELSTGIVITVAGSGACGSDAGRGLTASFCQPIGLAISSNGDYAVVADSFFHMVRVIFLPTMQVENLCGAFEFGHIDGPCSSAKFAQPHAVAYSPDNSHIYVAGSKHVRRINLNEGVVATVNVSSHEFGAMQSIVCTNNHEIMVSDNDQKRIYRISHDELPYRKCPKKSAGYAVAPWTIFQFTVIAAAAALLL